MSVAKITPIPRTEMDALLLGRLDELTVSGDGTGKNKNLLGILLSILVLILISSMIVAAIVIINPEIVNIQARRSTPREAVTLEDAFLGELYPQHFHGQWLPRQNSAEDFDELLFEEAKNIKIARHSISKQQRQKQFQLTDSNGTIELFNKAPNITTLVANSSLLVSVDFEGFKLSPSKRYLLVWTNRIRQFRHSYSAKYYIYDTKLDLITLISTAESNQNNFENLDTSTGYLIDDDPGDAFSRFQQAEWFSSPQLNQQDQQEDEGGRDGLILIQNNDIYLLTDLIHSKAAASSGNSERGGFKRRAISPVRLTRTGKENEIYNGISDWLYEEEILSDSPAYQVSPKASSLAYMSFNDSLVDLMPFSIYGPLSQILPLTQHIRYSKAGRPNPLVTVLVIDNLLSSDSSGSSEIRSIQVKLPEELAGEQHYITRIKWVTNDKLAIVWLNRNQNKSNILICSRISNWACEVNFQQTSSDGWLDVFDDLFSMEQDQSYLALAYKDEGPDVGRFRHVAMISHEKPNSFKFLTSGRREVVSIDGIDEARKLLYYTATVENEPGQRQVHVMNYQNSADSCLTCDHKPGECLYNSIKLSSSARFYTFECHGPGVPQYDIRELKYSTDDPIESTKPDKQQESFNATITTIEDQPIARGEYLWTAESNEALKYKLTVVKAMPLVMRLKAPIFGTNYSANVLMLLPPQLGHRSSATLKPASSLPSFLSPTQSSNSQQQQSTSNQAGDNQRVRSTSSGDSFGDGIEHLVHESFTPETIKNYEGQLSNGQRFPLVVDVYGGPGSQKVDFRFGVNFGHYMASSRRTIYVMIDGRGSGFEGTKRLYELYHKFGTVEIQDQIDTVRHLTKTFSMIDPDRTAIWGWSYGGYAAAMALAQGSRPARLSTTITTTSATNQPQNGFSLKESLHNQVKSSKSAANRHVTPAQGLLYSPSTLLPVPTHPVFQCAASVAPVTNWIYYDTAYTERYMSSPYFNERYDNTLGNDHHQQQNQQQINSSSTSFSLKSDPLDLINKFLLHNSQSSADSTEASLAAASADANNWVPMNPSQQYNNNNSSNNNSSISQPIMVTQAQIGSINSKLSPKLRDHYNRQASQFDLNDRYRRASLIESIPGIDRKRFLLIHGTADDNVHFQQSIMLMKQMIRKNILFESRLYPDQDHAIGRGSKADKLHLGNTLSNFFSQCLEN